MPGLDQLRRPLIVASLSLYDDGAPIWRFAVWFPGADAPQPPAALPTLWLYYAAVPLLMPAGFPARLPLQGCHRLATAATPQLRALRLQGCDVRDAGLDAFLSVPPEKFCAVRMRTTRRVSRAAGSLTCAWLGPSLQTPTSRHSRRQRR